MHDLRARIAARDNIPLVSYALLRGRCRHCAAPIPVRYPIVELVTALLVAACVLRYGATAEALLAAAFCAVLVAVAAIDAEHRIVPNRIVLPGAAVFLVARLLLEPSLQWPLAALAASGALLAVALAYPAGLGMGDVKLALLLGAALGATVAVALMVGLLAALVPAASWCRAAGRLRPARRRSRSRRFLRSGPHRPLRGRCDSGHLLEPRMRGLMHPRGCRCLFRGSRR